MNSRHLFFFFLSFLIFSSPSHSQAFAQDEPPFINLSVNPYTPFSIALHNLQTQINYTFKSIGLLRQAMTHASFSEENNKAFAVLGATIIEASVALQELTKNADISSKDMSDSIADASKVDGSCNADGLRLGLHKIVRVSHKTNVTAPSVICGAFRSMFGAIAVDAASLSEAGGIYLNIRSGIGQAAPM